MRIQLEQIAQQAVGVLAKNQVTGSRVKARCLDLAGKAIGSGNLNDVVKPPFLTPISGAVRTGVPVSASVAVLGWMAGWSPAEVVGASIGLGSLSAGAGALAAKMWQATTLQFAAYGLHQNLQNPEMILQSATILMNASPFQSEASAQDLLQILLTTDNLDLAQKAAQALTDWSATKNGAEASNTLFFETFNAITDATPHAVEKRAALAKIALERIKAQPFQSLVDRINKQNEGSAFAPLQHGDSDWTLQGVYGDMAAVLLPPQAQELKAMLFSARATAGTDVDLEHYARVVGSDADQANLTVDYLLKVIQDDTTPVSIESSICKMLRAIARVNPAVTKTKIKEWLATRTRCYDGKKDKMLNEVYISLCETTELKNLNVQNVRLTAGNTAILVLSGNSLKGVSWDNDNLSGLRSYSPRTLAADELHNLVAVISTDPDSEVAKQACRWLVNQSKTDENARKIIFDDVSKSVKSSVATDKTKIDLYLSRMRDNEFLPEIVALLPEAISDNKAKIFRMMGALPKKLADDRALRAYFLDPLTKAADIELAIQYYGRDPGKLDFLKSVIDEKSEFGGGHTDEWVRASLLDKVDSQADYLNSLDADLANNLLSLFSVDELRNFIKYGGGDGDKLADKLPKDVQGRSDIEKFALLAVLLLKANDKINTAFFDRLRIECPRRKADIDNMEKNYTTMSVG